MKKKVYEVRSTPMWINTDVRHGINQVCKKEIWKPLKKSESTTELKDIKVIKRWKVCSVNKVKYEMFEENFKFFVNHRCISQSPIFYLWKTSSLMEFNGKVFGDSLEKLLFYVFLLLWLNNSQFVWNVFFQDVHKCFLLICWNFADAGKYKIAKITFAKMLSNYDCLSFFVSINDQSFHNLIKLN